MAEPRRSPLHVEGARAILDYDRAVFDRFLRKIRRLPKAEAVRDRGIGHLSLFGTLLHILHVREAWFGFVVRDEGRREAAFFGRPERNPVDWRGFDRYAREVWAAHDALAAELTEARLDRRYRAFWMPGRYSLGDVVLQVSFEQAHHLGEIIGALWVDDRRSPDMTWIEVQRDALGSIRRR